MLRVTDRHEELVTVEAAGVVHREDYSRLVPQLESIVSAHGGLRMLLLLERVEGWEAAAILEEVKFDWRHREQFEKVAVVGGHGLSQVMLKLLKPFVSGEVRFFDSSEAEEARDWLVDD